jgi:hypothetical protein
MTPHAIRTAPVLAALTVLLVAGSPKGWVLIGPASAYAFRLDSLEKHGGRSSGLLECTDPDVQEFGSILQTIRADGYRSKRVRLSAYVRTRDVEESARLWMRVDGPESSGIAFDNMAKRPFKGDTEWSRYDIVLDVPADAVQIGFGAILGGKGRLWVDDLVLEPVGLGVATTDMHAPPVPAKAVVPPGLPPQPVNADFEE